LPSLDTLKKIGVIFTLPRTSIVEEYDVVRLEGFKKKLEQDWTAQENHFFEKLESFFGVIIKEPFLVHVSNYGPLGRYLYQTKHIFINVYVGEKKFDAVRIAKHEIIHLLVEPFIQRFYVEHAQKEKIVDVIVNLFE